MLQSLSYLDLAVEKVNSALTLVRHPKCAAALLEVTMKICCTCKEEKTDTNFHKNRSLKDGLSQGCKDCSKIHSAKFRNSEKGRIAKKRERQSPNYKRYPSTRRENNCHSLVYLAIKRGNLIRGSCEICGNEKADAHHDDYDKPLEVRWLCKSHHWEWHNINGKGLNYE